MLSDIIYLNPVYVTTNFDPTLDYVGECQTLFDACSEAFDDGYVEWEVIEPVVLDIEMLSYDMLKGNPQQRAWKVLNKIAKKLEREIMDFDRMYS